MPGRYDRQADARTALIVGTLLRAGVIISALFVFAGGVRYLLSYGLGIPEYRVFTGEPTDLRRVHGIAREMITMHSRGIIQFGLLVLMLTPIVWVSFLFLDFLFRKDRVYTIVTAIVLTALAFSFFGKYI